MMRYLCLFILIFSLVGCATNKDLEVLRQQIHKLYQIQAEDKKEFSDQLQKLKQDVDEKLTSSSFKVRAGQADIATRVESLRIKVAKLEGDTDFFINELDRQKNSTATIKQELIALKNEINKIKEDVLILKKVLGISEKGKKKKLKNKKGTGSPLKHDKTKKQEYKEIEKGQNIEVSPRSLYEQGLKNFNQKKYYTAAHLFSLFIERYPKHRLISNAYFWRGECYFNLKQYAKAILNYQKVLDNYKTSNKYPACLLKEGMAFYRLGKTKAGKILLENLIKDFPNSKEAQYARKFLKNR